MKPNAGVQYIGEDGKLTGPGMQFFLRIADQLDNQNIATQDQAEAGTDNETLMSPLRTAQHVTARIATQAQAEAGTDASSVLSPERGAQLLAALEAKPITAVIYNGATDGPVGQVETPPGFIEPDHTYRLEFIAVGTNASGFNNPPQMAFFDGPSGTWSPWEQIAASTLSSGDLMTGYSDLTGLGDPLGVLGVVSFFRLASGNAGSGWNVNVTNQNPRIMRVVTPALRAPTKFAVRAIAGAAAFDEGVIRVTKTPIAG